MKPVDSSESLSPKKTCKFYSIKLVKARVLTKYNNFPDPVVTRSAF